MSVVNRLKSLFEPAPEVLAARRLFRAVMAEARRPQLFLEGGAADTLDGRFDLVAVHLYFVLRRLKAEGPGGKAMGQRLFDVAFAEFDEALREMGAGDLSVGKKIRKMAEAFYGRVDAYESALGAGTPDAFEAALVRNVYRGRAPAPEQLAYLKEELERYRRRIDSGPLGVLLQGELSAAVTAV